jgi:hypothetical protein
MIRTAHRSMLGVFSVLVMLSPVVATAWQAKANREEGEFKIFVGGKEIGSEKFVIVSSQDSSSSSSILEFRNPDQQRQRMHFESKLEMNGQYTPRSYELKSDVDGKKGVIAGTFPPNEAIFEYRSGEASKKEGLLVGDKFTILDTNLFHQFIFLARLYDFGGDKTQKFQVVIPQESDSGLLKITRLNKETIRVRNKKVQAHQLQIDSGAIVIMIWIDDKHVLYKIAVSEKNLEVVRSP